MNRTDVIRIAKEAGCTILDIPGVGQVARYNDIRITNLLERFAELVAAAEREACAVVCDEVSNTVHDQRMLSAIDCAAAIRARGDSK